MEQIVSMGLHPTWISYKYPPVTVVDQHIPDITHSSTRFPLKLQVVRILMLLVYQVTQHSILNNHLDGQFLIILIIFNKWVLMRITVGRHSVLCSVLSSRAGAKVGKQHSKLCQQKWIKVCMCNIALTLIGYRKPPKLAYYIIVFPLLFLFQFSIVGPRNGCKQ